MTPEGHPARSDPGQHVGPSKAVVLMRSTRASCIKARTQLWSTERPDIETQPCVYLVHRVTAVVAAKAGSIYNFVLKIFRMDRIPQNQWNG
jgi:hypothetical protein